MCKVLFATRKNQPQTQKKERQKKTFLQYAKSSTQRKKEIERWGDS